MLRSCSSSILVWLCLVLFSSSLFAQNTLTGLPRTGEQRRAAVAAVEPWLVRIHTIGGHEKVGSEFANESAGCGILLDREGHVLTAAFLFLHDPTSILLQFSDGTKKIARKIATDKKRMLTLLKVDQYEPDFLPREQAPVFDPKKRRAKSSVKIGEPCLAVGVALSATEPNLTSGIISGLNRIWGQAIQTDAGVGPNNYGGPLIDRDGKIIGILVPLSMSSSDLAAGAETYDAGVGMAIPWEDVEEIVQKLKQGKDREPGLIGVSFQDNQIFIGDATVAALLPQSPASEAGLKAGDRIVKINAQAMRNAMQVAMIFHSCYENDQFIVTFLRDGKEQTVDIQAVSASHFSPSR